MHARFRALARAAPLMPRNRLQDLEENIVALSTMKSSRFFVVFEKDILKWEQALSLVSEMVEIVLQVQRNWMVRAPA